MGPVHAALKGVQPTMAQEGPPASDEMHGIDPAERLPTAELVGAGPGLGTETQTELLPTREPLRTIFRYIGRAEQAIADRLHDRDPDPGPPAGPATLSAGWGLGVDRRGRRLAMVWRPSSCLATRSPSTGTSRSSWSTTSCRLAPWA